MSTKARILTIRLLEWIRENPETAEKLGIQEGERTWDSDFHLACLRSSLR